MKDLTDGYDTWMVTSQSRLKDDDIRIDIIISSLELAAIKAEKYLSKDFMIIKIEQFWGTVFVENGHEDLKTE